MITETSLSVQVPQIAVAMTSTANAMQSLCYVLVTPARNEAAFIEATIRSVINQTKLPKRWIIVSDGSIDGTDEIVRRYAIEHSWIELLRMPERKERSFGGKVLCFEAAYTRLKDTTFDIIANLDADITFSPGYIAFLVDKFIADPELGIAGTPFVENGTSYDFRFTSLEHVSGACQLFRRACYEQIGGYVPVKGGGIDWIAVISARMHGWRTRTFTETVCYHHRPMGTASSGKLIANFRLGRQDYYLGGHPLWQIIRATYQLARPPYIIGGTLILAGYGWGWLTRAKRPVSKELTKFHRTEQMQRLRKILLARLLKQN
jgi:glycosyltransferase involved in cell wall biosynthesis